MRFFVIPGSRTNDILNLPSTSNVARDGQLPWMFRTLEASVEAGGCNTKGTILQTQVKFKETLQSHRHRSVDVVGHLKREK